MRMQATSQHTWFVSTLACALRGVRSGCTSTTMQKMVIRLFALFFFCLCFTFRSGSPSYAGFPDAYILHARPVSSFGKCFSCGHTSRHASRARTQRTLSCWMLLTTSLSHPHTRTKNRSCCRLTQCTCTKDASNAFARCSWSSRLRAMWDVA